MTPNQRLQHALNRAGFSSLKSVADLGFVGWHPPPRNNKGVPYRYKSLGKTTAAEIQCYAVCDDQPNAIQCLDDIRSRLPVRFHHNLPRQLVAQRFPYGSIGIAALYHAQQSRNCSDLQSLDFYFGCSVLEFLSAERKTSRRNRKPFYVMKVPGTDMIMLRSSLNFVQDYSAIGFQYERLLTGKPLQDRQYEGCTEHVQLMTIGNHHVLMAAETDAVDSTSGDPVELKCISGDPVYGKTKTFFQMVCNGSLTLYQGRRDNVVLKSIQTVRLEEMAEELAQHHDITALERKILRNMERLKEWDRQGCFDQSQVYQIDFNPGMELHRIHFLHPLLPPKAVVKKLLNFF